MRASARVRTAPGNVVLLAWLLVAVLVGLAAVPAVAGPSRDDRDAAAYAPDPLAAFLPPSLVGDAGGGGQDQTVTTARSGTETGAQEAVRGSTRRRVGVADQWTGFAFDACRAPASRVMDRWRVSSPFLGVGIYIGGALRACPQKRLSAGWVRHQTRQGWKLLPIWVGPQASCRGYTRSIDSHPGARHRYPGARAQGAREARGARAAAARLGIPPGSTLWYDLEWFPTHNTRCRNSALQFVSAWTRQLHRTGYKAGVYSSVSAGIAVLGRSRGSRAVAVPDRLWFAWANGRRDDAWHPYLRAPRWKSGNRVHQYALDVRASYGGTRLAIDRNYVSLGSSPELRRRPAVCGPIADAPRYSDLRRGSRGDRVRAAQCLLRAFGRFHGEVGGAYGTQTQAAVRSFQARRGLATTGRVDDRTWTALLATGTYPVLKYGSEGEAVRRVQRALTAALPGVVPVRGRFGAGTAQAVRRYQARTGLRVNGIVTPATWHALTSGRVAPPRPAKPAKHGHHAAKHPAKHHKAKHHAKSHHVKHGKKHHGKHGHPKHHRPKHTKHRKHHR